MKNAVKGLFLIIFGIAGWTTHAQTYNFPTVYSPASCAYTYEITITVRLDSVGITNIYFDDGTTGSFAFEAYVSYDNSILNSTLPAGNFYTYEITVYSNNPNLSSPSLTNNANSVPLVTNAAGGIASQNNPTYVGSASALGLSQGQYYSSPSLLTQLGYDSATIRINLPCMDTIVEADSVIPLPILWSKLSATNRGGAITLNWQTFMEQNNAGFNIEESSDGNHWSVVSSMKSKAVNGNSNTPLSYDFAIYKTPGTYYYRVTQKDIEGDLTQSNVVKVFVDGVPDKMYLYPNPAQNELYLMGAPDQLEYYIFDASGRQLAKGHYNKKIDLSGFDSGIYWIQYGSQHDKIVVNKKPSFN